jgi:type I restriction enzyme, S subunit
MTWQIKKLGEVCEVSAGGSAPQGEKYFRGGNYPFFRTSDVGSIHLSSNFCDVKDYLNKGGVEKLRLHKKGTILFPKSGASTFLNHRVIMGCDGYISSHLATILPHENVDPKFVYYYLVLVDAKSLAPNSVYPSLRLSDIAKIPVPRIEEQKKSVAKIEELMAKIDEAKKLREEAAEDTKNFLPSALHKIFTEEKTKGWQEKPLEQEVRKVTDGTHDTPKYHARGIPLITSKNLLESGLDFSNIKYISENDHEKIIQRSKVDRGDLLIAMIGTIGNITLVNTDKVFSIKNVGLIKPDKSKILGKYIYYFLHNSRLQELIIQQGGTQKFIALGAIRSIKIQFPSLSEQKKIVEYLDSLSEKTKQIQILQDETASDFEELEQSILRKAFAGELV